MIKPCWYYTYVLKCQKTSTFYTGCTSNLKQRLKQHQKGEVYSTKYKLPVELIYFEGCLDKADAFRRERYLKTGMGKRYLKNRMKKGLTEG
ncbi:MAG: GIY-YIG nuclease superfamily protein [Planctomycetes bacterium ADurb.Bin401]|nr:MAG: GIY-YIG nuclease superfamily protein [Planctomycetes bacterium ADurb.Bin401]